MFERYTERARRVLFFARFEASQLGSIAIETEHLLLGLMREGKGLTSRIFARSHVSHESIRREIEGRTVFREKISTAVEIPFSAETKRALQFAAEEADRLLHNYIGSEHLLLGILREERTVAASILMEKGIRLPSVREDIVQLLNEQATLTRAGTADESLSAPFSPSARGPQTPDFLPSYAVHIMYSHTGGTARVSTLREWSLCGFTLRAALASVCETDESRIELPPALATDQRYDIVVKLPRDEPRETIHTLVRQAIRKQFGVEVTTEGRSTDVYVLTAPQGAGPALRAQPESQGGAGGVTFGFSTTREHQDERLPFPMDRFSLSGMPVQMVAHTIEEILGGPVVDETGLTGIYDLELRGPIEGRDAFIRALRDEAGLIATPGRRDIQVLVVRQAGGG